VTALQVWIPVVLAFLGFLTALLERLGKKKAEKGIGVLVDAIEIFEPADSELKKSIAFSAELQNVGELIHGIVKNRTVKQ